MPKFRIHSGLLCLAVLSLFAATPVLSEDNHGDVVYNANTDTPATHIVTDGYVNHGTAKMIGKDGDEFVEAVTINGGLLNHGTVTSTGGAGVSNRNGGDGIHILDGGFTNHGTVKASGED
ncbi:MAG: hypothetical protein LIP23_08695, partial [Planctomycetes bacterium]|nr:hypothetical protein [Planctomycetota bacterium]